MRAFLASLVLLGSFAGPGRAAADDDLAAALRAEIDRMRIAYDVQGVAVTVVQGREVILADGFGAFAEETPAGPDTACTLFSATKALTAFTLASLVEDGAIDLDAPLGAVLPEAPDAWREIAVWRLYNHTSGIPMIVNQPVFEAIAQDPDGDNRDIFDVVSRQPLDYAPGAFSRYRQSGYAVAELIAQALTGDAWPALMDRHLTSPAGAAATVHGPSADGEKTAPMLTSAGFYRTTPSDMAAIFQALNDGRVVSPDGLTDTLLNPAYIHDGYGLGVIHETVGGEPTIGHRGGGARANIRYAPGAGVGVMACIDQQPNQELTIHIADMAMRALLTNEPPLPDIAVALLENDTLSGEALTALLETERTRERPHYSFDREQSAVNRAGYAHLRADRVEPALALFAYNTRRFPQSANAWDSLADAQEASNDPAGALASVRRAAALAPGDARLADRLAALER